MFRARDKKSTHVDALQPPRAPPKLQESGSPRLGPSEFIAESRGRERASGCLALSLLAPYREIQHHGALQPLTVSPRPEESSSPPSRALSRLEAKVTTSRQAAQFLNGTQESQRGWSLRLPSCSPSEAVGEQQSRYRPPFLAKVRVSQKLHSLRKAREQVVDEDCTDTSHSSIRDCRRAALRAELPPSTHPCCAERE